MWATFGIVPKIILHLWDYCEIRTHTHTHNTTCTFGYLSHSSLIPFLLLFFRPHFGFGSKFTGNQMLFEVNVWFHHSFSFCFLSRSIRMFISFLFFIFSQRKILNNYKDLHEMPHQNIFSILINQLN